MIAAFFISYYKMSWIHHKSIVMGGLVAIGFDRANHYLLAVSHSGRGLFKLESGERIARDYEDWAGRAWYSPDDNRCEGIGPLQNETFDIVGLHGGVAYEEAANGMLKCRVERNEYAWRALITREGIDEEICSDEEDLKGVALSRDGKWFVVGISSEIEIYRNTAA
ncbi:hypothetical protein OVA24_04050 [Luteolibacter sp. SL250]|uniref:hypothetical protein n=1 Tax=Luteolibacter sp. SL250 TaxID=2995170 RepID=UPI0022717AF0|nr:hypothetical protein [Luteolibacter sp. SL250]WAC20550.1 hypothetical protein OVA24_04050 [Luteolibacter sp. SL250]